MNFTYCRCLLLTLFISITTAFSAQAATDVAESVLKDIKNVQQSMSRDQTKINQQQQQLNKLYQDLQQQVQSLRDKTAVLRRAEDESTLGLSQLTERLKTWQSQQHYQQNQLASFLRQQHNNDDHKNLLAQLQAASKVAAHLQQGLYPKWQAEDIAAENGEIIAAKVLTLGPISWYWLPQTKQGGLLQQENNMPTIALPFSDNTGLAKLQHDTYAELSLDPSLNKALLRNNQQESTLTHISKGGVWALPILLFALIAVVIAIHKAWQLWRLPAVNTAPPAIDSPDTKGSTDKAANVAVSNEYAQQLTTCYHQHAIGQQRDDALFAVLQQSRLKLDARIGAIAVTAAVAPLLGLLGTVSGMIETFNMMTLFGSGDPQVVSGGIAQALITTELGLVVAIPALVLHALLSRSASRYYHQLEALALNLSQRNGQVDNPLALKATV